MSKLYEYWKNYQRPILLDIFLLCLFFVPLYLYVLGDRPFATPDEARYVEIPREILLNNDWVTPRLNGIKYFEKPPLMYWLLAIMQKMCSLSEWAMRLPLAVFGLMGISSVYYFGRVMFNRITALLASFILGTSVLWFALSRLIILDMPVSVFVTIALLSFYCAMTTPSKRKTYLMVTSIACALGVLTKGLMVLAIVGVVMVLWTLLTNRWRQLLPLYLPRNLLIFFMIAAPWHIMAALANPGFAHKYFIVEHVHRYLTSVHMRYQPPWFFIPILLVGFLPWTGFLLDMFIQHIRKAITKVKPFTFKPLESTPLLFCGIWAAFIFCFFSMGNSKLIPYILPMFPALALMVSHYLTIAIQSQQMFKLFNTTSIVLCCMAVLLSSVSVWSLYIPVSDLDLSNQPLLPYISMIGIVLGSMAVISFPALQLKAVTRIVGLVACSTFLLMIIARGAVEGQKPSFKEFIHTMLADQKTQHRTDDVIFSFYSYHQDLAVYAKSRVVVVNYVGELEFGATLEDQSAYLLSLDQFKRRVENEKNKVLWVFLKEGLLPDLLKLIPGQSILQQTCKHKLCMVKVSSQVK